MRSKSTSCSSVSLATGIVEARRLHGAGRIEPRRWSRGEESGCATDQCKIGAHLVLPLPHGIALGTKQARIPIIPRFVCDSLPERTQLVDACFRRIAGNQRPIDRADRDAGDPVGVKIGLAQCLIDPGLIGTERTTPLEEERDALERRTWPRPCSHIAGLRCEPPRGGDTAALVRRRSYKRGAGLIAGGRRAWLTCFTHALSRPAVGDQLNCRRPAHRATTRDHADRC